ncbi:D-alanyl-D-alanine carboxypeptidase family protein [Plasticicumulans sp.]|uniref:D-alanyl-D-alanine carboxypeptidase family protein n=1 Tax=Plasticicumulans sp. TaxID=2307179 RepID=UPI002D124FDB|nr:D-alanyl-D-alanine carboxypeptidase family protein [Plasticicumulans sp.]
MRLSVALRFLLSFVLLFGPGAAALAVDAVPAAPDLPVRAYVLVDYASENVLAGKLADERIEPASITKLMAAYVIYQSIHEGKLKLDDQVLISENAWRTEGSRMFAEVNSRVPADALLMGMVIQSGNDATVALAEHIAGSETTFVDLMNKWAKQLGLTRSHFMNATGLPHPDHYMTAHDIAKLARALIHDFPEQYARYAIKEFTYNNITQHNRNRLLWLDPSVDGVKTGHTSSAGYCLVTSAKREQGRMIAVVLGAKAEKDRVSASQALLNYGFSFYTTRLMHEAGVALAEPRVWLGDAEKLPLGLAEPLGVTVPKGKAEGLKSEIQVNPQIEAPVGRGSVHGKVVVTLDGNTVAEAPLVALQDVAEGSFFSRLLDHILMLFHKLIG